MFEERKLINELVDWCVNQKGNSKLSIGWHVGQVFTEFQNEYGTIWKNDRIYDRFLKGIEKRTGVKYLPQYALYDIGGHDRKELVCLLNSENEEIVWEA